MCACTVLEPIGSVDEERCDIPRMQQHQRTQSSFVLACAVLFVCVYDVCMLCVRVSAWSES